MDKQSVIKALQTGMVQAIDIIKHLNGHLASLGEVEDPIITHEIEKLEQLLGYTYARTQEAHSLYSN